MKLEILNYPLDKICCLDLRFKYLKFQIFIYAFLKNIF